MQTNSKNINRLISYTSQINWVHAMLLTSTPVLALYGVLTTKLNFNTLVWSLFYYFFSALGITAGYHRLWSHRAYQATPFLKVILALAGASAVQGSILWWCRDHRVHHRYTDTEKDPYSAPKGFLWSHLGWMIFKKDKSKIGRAETDDLESCLIVKLQNKFYPILSILMGVVVPTLIAHFLWNDFRGGYYYAGVLRLVFVHHATFCVNSLAHWLGEINYDDKHTPRDHFITALVTNGEGYHNFHHQYPQDYRNAIKYYQYDPTKWFIYSCYLLGLAYNLKKFNQNEIHKGNFNMRYKKLQNERKGINWGVDVGSLSSITVNEYKQLAKAKNWILIDNIVHDVTEFIDEHPGGRKYILSGVGTDATSMFNGKVYDHSNAARNLLQSMRVAKIIKTE